MVRFNIIDLKSTKREVYSTRLFSYIYIQKVETVSSPSLHSVFRNDNPDIRDASTSDGPHQA